VWQKATEAAECLCTRALWQKELDRQFGSTVEFSKCLGFLVFGNQKAAALPQKNGNKGASDRRPLES
jgi:hypothetical protein